MRAQASQARCHEVVRDVYGKDDAARYEQLRAFEPSVVGEVAGKLETLARQDSTEASRGPALAALVQAIAAAQREAMYARRAGAKVKRDLDREPSKLSSDEVGAVAPLRDTRMLKALLDFKADDLTPEAHALGILSATDRMEIARELPKHLKIYAVAGANQLLFGVQPPPVPADATEPLKPGTWLAYLLGVARAAGHPVPDSAKTPKQKDPLAWTGTLEGYADKLRGDVDRLPPASRLHQVASVVVQRLDAEYKSTVSTLTEPPPRLVNKAPQSNASASNVPSRKTPAANAKAPRPQAASK
jgi:hypothetical protein